MSVNFRTDPADLAKLEKDLNDLPKIFDIIHYKYSHALAGGWKEWIVKLNTIDTRRFLFSVAAHKTSGIDAESTKAFVIDTSANPAVIYSWLVEFGRQPGGAPPNENHPGYAPRMVVDRSLEAQDSVDKLDQIAGNTLAQFLYG